MLQSGFRDRNGEQLQGLRDLMEQLRQRRRDLLDSNDLGGVYDEVAQELGEVVQQEREALEQLRQEAAASGDQRRQEITEEVASQRNLQLDFLPEDLAGKVRELQQYEFTSSEARERFEALMDKLRQQLMQQTVDQMAGAMQNQSPEQLQRMKDMMAELNHMLDQRARARSPTSRGSWTASATSSRRTRSRSTSCSRPSPSGWPPCRRCSTP
jgi:uncharacterized protein with von Willebrand factor type A (vWA) domain